MNQYSDKLKKTLRFYNGVRTPAVFAAISPYGLTRDVLAEGAGRLEKAANLRKQELVSEGEAPDLTARAEGYQSLWIPITRATLNGSYPELGQAFCDGMVQRKGAEAPLGVTTLVTRVEELESPNSPWGPNSAAARQRLNERGLTPAVVNDGKGLLTEWRDVSESPVVSAAEAATSDDFEQAIESAWDWYVEWSTIARAVLKSKRHLHALGLSPRRAKEIEELPALAAAPSSPALPARSENATAAE